MNCVSIPVSPITGLMALTRMFFGASSTAIDFVSVITAPLVPLYQVRPGRGRMPAVEAILMMVPAPRRSISRDGGERRQVDRLHVDGVDAIELGFADIEQRLIAVRDAGVVDQDVEAAEGFGRRAHHGVDIGLLGDVAGNRDDVVAERRRNLPHALAVDVGQRRRARLRAQIARRSRDRSQTQRRSRSRPCPAASPSSQCPQAPRRRTGICPVAASRAASAR